MEVEFEDEVAELVVVKKEFDHCQENQQLMLDIEEQQKVNRLRREQFENHRWMNCWMLSMI
jgi:hypothetical protein